MDSFTPLSNHLSALAKRFTLLSSKQGFLSFRSKWTRGAGPCVVPFVHGEVVLSPNVQICAVLAALNSINYITLFTPGCFVLRMDEFLPQCVGGFKVSPGYDVY